MQEKKHAGKVHVPYTTLRQSKNSFMCMVFHVLVNLEALTRSLRRDPYIGPHRIFDSF